MTGQAALWTLAAGGAAVSVLSALADTRRSRRPNLDRPGWIPWAGMQIIGVLVAVVAAALAFQA